MDYWKKLILTESDGLKPDWLELKRLLSSRNLDIEFNSNFLKLLPQIINDLFVTFLMNNNNVGFLPNIMKNAIISKMFEYNWWRLDIWFTT